MIQEDIKDFIEYQYNGNVKAYPNVIPQGECLPAIMYRFTGDSRDSDSKLDGADVESISIQVIVITKSYKKTAEMSETVKSAFKNFSGKIVDTNVFMSRISNKTELYNSTQQTHETTIEVNLKIRR